MAAATDAAADAAAPGFSPVADPLLERLLTAWKRLAIADRERLVADVELIPASPGWTGG